MTELDPKVQALLDAVDMFLATPKGSIYENNLTAKLILARNALHPEPAKPREWWLSIPRDLSGYMAYSNREYAESNNGNGEIIYVREVLPDEKPAVWMPEWKDLPKNEGEYFVYLIGEGTYIYDEKGYNTFRNKLMGLDE